MYALFLFSLFLPPSSFMHLLGPLTPLSPLPFPLPRWHRRRLHHLPLSSFLGALLDAARQLKRQSEEAKLRRQTELVISQMGTSKKNGRRAGRFQK